MKNTKESNLYDDCIYDRCDRINYRCFSANASSSSYRRGDADGDGTVTILDATVIQRYLADFADPYHINEIVEEHTQPTQDEYELPFVPN